MSNPRWDFATLAVIRITQKRLARKVLREVRWVIDDREAFSHVRPNAEACVREFLDEGPGYPILQCGASYHAKPERLGTISDDSLAEAATLALRRMGPCLIGTLRTMALDAAWHALVASGKPEFVAVANRMRDAGGGDHLPVVA